MKKTYNILQLNKKLVYTNNYLAEIIQFKGIKLKIFSERVKLKL